MPATLRRLDRAEALEHTRRLGAIYARALGPDAEPAGHLEATVRQGLRDDGATVLVATEGQQVVGFLYGRDLQLRHWWPRQVAGPLTAAGHGHWLTDTFELVEVHVDPDAQGRGVGTALLRRQLSDMPQRRALLAADPEGRARALYLRLGFRVLVPDFVYAGTPYRAALMGWQRPPDQAAVRVPSRSAP